MGVIEYVKNFFRKKEEKIFNPQDVPDPVLPAIIRKLGQLKTAMEDGDMPNIKRLQDQIDKAGYGRPHSISQVEMYQARYACKTKE